VSPQATAGRIEVCLKPVPDMPSVRVDPELVVQVLVNLMLNAIDAMLEGGTLTVSIEFRPPELWIGVQDNGPGIPPQARNEIFRPFYTTKNRGTGLGLSISNQFVEQHGGSLRFEETPGGGATFIVVLPCPTEEIRS